MLMKRNVQQAGGWHDYDEMDFIGVPRLSFGLPALDRTLVRTEE